MYITYCKEVRKVWIEEEYRFIKPTEMDKKDFEKRVKEILEWNEDIEMEIEFIYMLDNLVLVTFRRRES
jgi:hypothetical protein